MTGDSILVVVGDNPDGVFLATSQVGASRTHTPTWAPNSRRFAWVEEGSGWWDTGSIGGSVIMVGDAVGGGGFPVTDFEHLNVNPVWLPDSRHLLFLSSRGGSRGVYLVEAGPRGAIGEPRLIPGISNPHSMAVSDDGSRMTYSSYTHYRNIWSVAIPDSGMVGSQEALQETFGNHTIEFFDVSPTGDSLVFESNRTGNMDVYKARRGSSDAVQLTTDEADDYAPAWSPDGKEIAFYSTRTGSGWREIWVMSADPGASLQRLTNHNDRAFWPRWSPDGLHITYQIGCCGDVDSRLWMVTRDSVNGVWGQPRQLTDFACGPHDWDPSGERIVCTLWPEEVVGIVSKTGQLGWSRSASAYEPGLAADQSATPSSPTTAQTAAAAFSSDGQRLLVRLDRDEIWRVVPDGQLLPELLFRKEADWHYQFRVHSGRLFFSVSEYQSDIWVIDLHCEICGEQ